MKRVDPARVHSELAGAIDDSLSGERQQHRSGDRESHPGPELGTLEFYY